jgi:hypothetical protein
MEDNCIDICAYVFDPLMRNMRAIERLMNQMRNNQDASCNNIECLANNNMNSLVAPQSFYASHWFLFFGWLVFALMLFLFRPNSMKKKNEAEKQGFGNPSTKKTGCMTKRRFDHEDDDNSTVS